MSRKQAAAGVRGFAAVLAGLAVAFGAGTAGADHGERGRRTRHCTLTALDQHHACLAETRDDFFSGQAKCRNVDEEDEREDCFDETRAGWKEGHALCRDQLGARRELCARLGEGRIDPEFEPELFDDPRSPANPNPYFPLAVGNRWVYDDGDDTVTVRVLDETKRIDGVDCIVVNDRGEGEGQVEDTDDWFGIRKDGSVAYCGEISQDLETFEGDDPQDLELVSIDGSWKAGREGDLAGTIFLADPEVGDVYRQEWSAGNAEDAAEVLSIRYRYGADAELDRGVNRALVEHLCSAGDCVVTRDFNPLDPGSFERKYYARGIGLFMEVKPETGATVELRECDFHAKCAGLP
jgi:hypothetical protein